MFTPQGPAGIFALYLLPGSNLGQVFLNEFVCVRTTSSRLCKNDLIHLPSLVSQDFLIAIVIWACLDPTNFLVSPTMAPWVIALT